MILTEQQPSSPSSKRSFLSISVPSQPESPEDEAPPAYHPPLPTSPVPPPPPTPIHKEHPNTGKRRFWRAVLIGLGVYVVVSATVITPLLVLKLRGSKSTITPDPVQTSPVPDHRDPHRDPHDRPPPPHDRPQWPPPGGADGDGRWDMPPPRHGDHPHPPPPGGPHGPKGWHPDCGGEGDGRPGCHRPPNVPHWDGRIVQCNAWRRPTLEEQLPATDPLPFNSFLMYEMPLDKDLFVRAAGLITAGAFQLVVDDKIEKIQAHVEMRFNEHRSYEHTNVCLMDRQHSNPPAMGLGIYMPFGQAPDENILFNITLRVPPMHYNGTLDTHLPVFEQKILSDPRVYFDRLRLSGSASPMLMQGVDAGTIDAMTQYARIKADGVRAGRRLRLATNASPIDATIAVTSNSSSSEPVVIDMQTINAHIAGTVLLAHDGTIKASRSEGTPDFSLDARTGNSPIFMRVLHTEQSQPAVLHANLTTNLAEIEVSLDPSYEGTFELLTDGTSAAEVEEDAKHTLDPSGMGRKRDVSLHRDGEGSVRGSVAWRNLSFRMKEGALGIWGADKLKDTSLGGSRVRSATSLGQNTLLLPNSQDMLRDTEERAAHFRTLKEDEVDTVAERMRKVGSAVSA